MGEINDMYAQGHTIAEVFNTFGREYNKKHTIKEQHKHVISNIVCCKTAAMGSHWRKCPDCGHKQQYYNSCGDRHCPGCQGINKEKWILERKYDILPVKYFHVVFTVPAMLRSLFLQNKELLFNLLFKCSWLTLNEFGWDKRQKMQAQIGAIAILHTWTQKLEFHPHIHFMIPGGGIDKSKKWRKAKGSDNFLFYVSNLAKKFRGKFLDKIYKLFLENKLILNGKLQEINSKTRFYEFKDKLYNKDWVVFTKKPFNNPYGVIEYLARYTNKIAIGNYRILDINRKAKTVTFSYLDREDKYTKKELILPADKFIKRFLYHILPPGFTRIRHYGFLSCRTKASMLKVIRRLLGVKEPEEKIKLTVRLVMIITKGFDPFLCKKCKKGIMVEIARTPRARGQPGPGAYY